MFDYFYGAQAEQFAFYRVPKVLFTNERFKYLSAEAKTLYGILLDRVPLSAKNGWIDEQGRVYIICTIEEIMADMNCGNKKAIQLLSDLEDKVGLIERKRQGLGKPNLIYVKNFISVDSPVERHFLKCQNDTSGSVEITSLEVSKGHGNKTDIINTEYSDTDSFYSDRGVGKGSEAMRIRAQYEDYFRESLELDYLSRDRTLDQDALHAMVDLMVDVCCSTRKSIRINREDMPIEVVKSRFMKLDAEHIKYALMTLANNTTRVKDMGCWKLVYSRGMEQIALYHRNSRQAPLDFKHPEMGRYHQQKDQLYFKNIALALNYIYDHDEYKAAVKRGDKRIVYKNKKYEKQAKKREQRAALRRVDRLFKMIEKERKEKENVAVG